MIFPEQKKETSLIFKAKTDKIISIYRINIETPLTEDCELMLLPLEKVSLKPVDSTIEESYDDIEDWIAPMLDELTPDQETKLEKNLVWIFGSARSGTTWLGRQLLSFNTNSVNEPHITEHLAMRAVAISHKMIRRIDHMKKFPSYFFSKRYYKTWKFYLRKMILNRIYAEINDITKKVIVKEPGGGMGASDVIGECLPTCKMIMLLRDGRDVLDSLIDARQKEGFMTKNVGTTPLTTKDRPILIKNQSKLWVKLMENLLETYQKRPKGTVLLLKYEDLLRNTIEELRKLYDFVGIDIPNEKLQEIVNKFSFINIPESEKGQGKFTRSATPGKWKENFSKEEIKIFC